MTKINYENEQVSLFRDHETDYENVASNSLIACMYSQLSVSNCPMGGTAIPFTDNEQF